MPNVNQNFGGAQLIIPGGYYQDNVANVLPAAAFPGLPLIFIGVGYGGQPYTPYAFSNPNALKSFLRGSASARYVDFFNNPSSQVPGAGQYVFINAASNTPASASLSASTTAVINLTANNYGAPGNTMTFQVQSGSVAGINLSISDPMYTGANFTGYNLGVPFSMTYTGTASAAKYSVVSSGGNATTLVVSGANSGENFTLDLTNSAYNMVSAIVGYLNGTGHFSAQILSSDANLPSSALDTASAISLTPSSAVNVTATIGDIVFWVNNTASALASAVAVTGITSGPVFLPSTTATTFFSGGANNAPSTSNYASALNAALNVGGWVVFSDSNSAAVRALGQQHVAQASGIATKQWRRFVTGSTLGDSVSTTVSAAQALNAINCTYVYPGIMANDPNTGILTTYGGLYSAAVVAGMMAGSPFAVPFTNKVVNASGLEFVPTTAQINTLQQGGVMPLYISPATGVPTIVSDLTTWQNDNNPENVFNQQVACRYALAYTLTQNIQPYVGQVSSTQSMTRVQNAVIASLNALLYNDASQQGILNSWDQNSLILTYNGTTQTLSVIVNVVFVGQYRFIEFTVSVEPLSLVSTPQT